MKEKIKSYAKKVVFVFVTILLSVTVGNLFEGRSVSFSFLNVSMYLVSALVLGGVIMWLEKKGLW